MPRENSVPIYICLFLVLFLTLHCRCSYTNFFKNYYLYDVIGYFIEWIEFRPFEVSYNESEFLPLFKSIFFLFSIIIATSDFQKFSIHGDGFEMISFRYSQSWDLVILTWKNIKIFLEIIQYILYWRWQSKTDTVRI